MTRDVAPEDLVATLEWPVEWFGLNTWLRTDLVTVLQHGKSGDRVYVAGGVLTDGTNLIGIVSEKSKIQNVARSGPKTGWSLEERIDPRMPRYLRPIWANVVEAMIQAKRDAEAELGPAARFT